MASLNTYAKNNISTLIALDQKIEEITEKKEIALLLIQQKRILQQLKKNASRGNAILGLAVLKAMIITGMDFHKFFDYTTPYVDNRGYDKIKELVSFDTFLPLMKKYNTIEKADSILPFVRHLPNLKKEPFSIELFNLLNEQDKKTKKSFQERLFNRLKEDYFSNQEDKKHIQEILKTTCQKGYSGAILLYSEILADQENAQNESIILLKSLPRNKFASESDRAYAHLIINKYQKIDTRINHKKTNRILKETPQITY